MTRNGLPDLSPHDLRPVSYTHLFAGDEPVPFIVGRGSSRVVVIISPIVTTFANGIKSAFTGAVDAVKGGLQRIRNLLPFSDAKLSLIHI